MTRSLSIEIPADPSYLRLVRMLVAAFAAELGGMDEDRAAVVRLAASETCTAALAAVLDQHRTGTVAVEAALDGHGVLVEVRTACEESAAPWDLTVVRALADDVHVRTEGGERVATLHVASPGRTGAPAPGAR